MDVNAETKATEKKVGGWLKRVLSCLVKALKFWTGRIENSGVVRRLGQEQIDVKPHSKLWFLKWGIGLCAVLDLAMAVGYHYGRAHGVIRIADMHTDTVNIGKMVPASTARYWQVEYMTCEANLEHAVEHDGPVKGIVVSTPPEKTPAVKVVPKPKPVAASTLTPADKTLRSHKKTDKDAACGVTCQMMKKVGVN